MGFTLHGFRSKPNEKAAFAEFTVETELENRFPVVNRLGQAFQDFPISRATTMTPW